MISNIKIIMRWLVRRPPFNFAVKIATATSGMMDGIVNMFEDIADIGTIPDELEDYYEELARVKCDADTMRGWGCVIGSFGEMKDTNPANTVDVCPISHEPFEPNTIIAMTDCFHVFEFESLKEWFSRSRACPMCRTRMVEQCNARPAEAVVPIIASVDVR